MADSLVLEGIKTVKKHKGSDMLLIRPSRGGDLHSIKKWWSTGGSVVYTPCSLLQVSLGTKKVYLALEVSNASSIRVDHYGGFDFAFYGIKNIKRGALLDENYNVIEHYMFPSISSGRTMTITPPGAAVRPDLSTSLGEVTIQGPKKAQKNEEVTYTLNLSGDASLIKYVWSATGSAKIIGDTDQQTVLVSGSKKGTYAISCKVSTADEFVVGDTTVAVSHSLTVL